MPKAAGKDKEMDGVEKAAILLIALGPEKSAQIFKHLMEPKESRAFQTDIKRFMSSRRMKTPVWCMECQRPSLRRDWLMR